MLHEPGGLQSPSGPTSTRSQRYLSTGNPRGRTGAVLVMPYRSEPMVDTDWAGLDGSTGAGSPNATTTQPCGSSYTLFKRHGS